MELLKERIEKLAEHIREVFRKNDEVNKFVLPSDTVEVHYLSKKWVRIDRVRQPNNQSRGVYCFVALTDFSTKFLGQIKAGDIHMAASYKAPAKHARGSVFSEDFGGCCGPYGVKYLRG